MGRIGGWKQVFVLGRSCDLRIIYTDFRGANQIVARSPGVPTERGLICIFFLPTKRPDGTICGEYVPSGRVVGRICKIVIFTFHRNVSC